MEPSKGVQRPDLRRTRAQPFIDKRSKPSDGWAIGKWFRRSPLAAGLAAYFDMSNVASDMTLDALPPSVRNNLAAPDWPEEAASPVYKRGKLVGLDLAPVEIPVIAPMPIFWPDVIPDYDPTAPLPVRRPDPAPRPLGKPEPKAATVNRPLGRPKTQSEITIVIERVPGRFDAPQPAIRVRAVQRFKYQIFANQVRRVDVKGVYLRIQQLVTLTFGTLTEVQDFVEAAAWNVVDRNGVPVMGRHIGLALDDTEGMSNKLRGLTVNMAAYYAAFDGLMRGDYSLDLGGFVFDYTMAQMADNEIAFQSRKLERVARRLGLDSVMGVDGMLGMHRRLAGMPRQERMSYVREIQKQWSSTFKGRVYWSRGGLSSRT